MKKSIGKRLHKCLSVAIVLVFIVTLLPQTTLAATTHTIENDDSLDISKCKDGDTIYIPSGYTATIFHLEEIKASKNVKIECGAGVTLNLLNVWFDVGDTGCALSFIGSGNTLNLFGTNILKSGTNEPGVRVEEGTELAIQNFGTQDGTLTVTGGENAAGIGGGVNSSGGIIIINSGIINAIGGKYGPGIGSGHNADDVSGSTITINDGTVSATGGEDAAGIGGGRYSDGGTVTIINGKVTAYGGFFGAGIGGGSWNNGSTITISGGEITAKGGEYGAGIGGGGGGHGGTITINAGTVSATGGENGAGIGEGTDSTKGTPSDSDVTNILINGGTVIADGGDSGAGIGGGYQGNGGSISISGGSITSTGDGGGAGIGGGCYSSAKTILIAGGKVTATSDSGAGIGGGCLGSGGTISITGGIITATGEGYGPAGVGGGTGGNGGVISISGGTVYAQRGYEWDGSFGLDIGYGSGKSGGTFTLSEDAFVFLYSDTFLTPETYAHIHFPKSGPLYDFSLPSNWEDAGILAAGNTLSYDDNGGMGTTEVPVLEATSVSLLDGDTVSNPGYLLKEWNTAIDGSGTGYIPGQDLTITENTTLYAIWEADDSSLISSVTPSETDADVDGNIVINFIEDMDTSVTGTVSLDGTALSDGIWSNYGQTFTVPYSELSYNQTYTINISGFADTYGTAMTTTSYDFKTEAPADLKSLSVGDAELSPDFDFDKDKAAYSVYTSSDSVNVIIITAETEDDAATLEINNETVVSGEATEVTLTNGANLIPVVVTAQDGTEKSYILSVNGTVSDAALGSLSIGGEAQTVGGSSFTASVGSDVTSIAIKASASDEKAIMLLDGAIFTSDAGQSVDLAVGENSFTLMVIAQDATTKSYTITINRGTSDATLSGLTLSDVTLSPSFNTTTYAYTATVANSVTSLTVIPTTSDSVATVTVNGNDAETPVSLAFGSNTVTIEVTGSDGVTTKTYTITVTRQAEIEISNHSLPIGIIGASYSVTMTAEGGTGSFTWSATGLPTSLLQDSTTGVLSGTLADGDEGTYNVTITATDENSVTVSESYTLVVHEGCCGGAYLIVSDGDSAYTGSYTDDGIPTLTVNDGVSGFTYFGVDISAVTGHDGKEVCLFVQKRDGEQIGFSFINADFDTVTGAGAAFNVRAGDVIEVYIVDALTNGSSDNPNVL